MIDNLEELLVIEKRINEGKTEDIRNRWESGKGLLENRAKPKGRGRPGIPKARMDELVKELGVDASELKRRMQFDDTLREGGDNFASVLTKYQTWRQICDNYLPKQRAPQSKSKSKVSAPKANPKRDKMVELAEQGKTVAQITEATGTSPHTVRRELEREAIEEQAAPVDYATMPGTAAEKLDRAKRSAIKELEREYRTRLMAEVDQIKAQLKDDVKAYKAKLDAKAEEQKAERNAAYERYQTAVAAYRAKGLIPVDKYKLVLSCLHPDSRNSVSNEKLAEAFRVFNDPKIKALLIKELTQPKKSGRQ